MHPWVSFEDGTRHLGLPVRPGGRKCVWVYTHSSRRPLIGRHKSENFNICNFCHNWFACLGVQLVDMKYAEFELKI